jgi:hypothetical protein
MFGMFESESWIGLLLGQLQYAVCLSMVQGGMAAWEVELWMADPTLSFTGVALGHNLASTFFGGTMPLVATWLFYRAESYEDDDTDFLFTKLLPGLYISFLGCLSFLCISFVIRHPHDVRTGELKIRNAANLELKKEAKKRKKKRKALERRKKEKQFHQGGKYHF